MTQPVRTLPENYLQAIAWAENRIKNWPTQAFELSPGVTTQDLNYTLAIAVERIRYGSPGEASVRFREIKKVKDDLLRAALG